MSNVIPCIHNGEKTKIHVDYDGVEKILEACNDCLDVIKISHICKILEVIE